MKTAPNPQVFVFLLSLLTFMVAMREIGRGDNLSAFVFLCAFTLTLFVVSDLSEKRKDR